MKTILTVEGFYEACGVKPPLPEYVAVGADIL